MITEIKCYVAHCDTCKGEPESGDGYVPHFSSPKEFEADRYEWTVWQDKDWCEYCGPPVCVCRHLFGEHDYGEAPCQQADCSCSEYSPQEKAASGQASG